MAFKVNDVEITSILNTGFKTGRDSENLIDFATTDNKLIFRVNNVNEVELIENALQPTTNDGVALGTTSLGWSDLHLASAGVINWVNGEMTITETDANTLTVAGGTFATAALTATTIAASDDVTIANGYGLSVGYTSMLTIGGLASELQVMGTTSADTTVAIGAFSTTAGVKPELNFMKSGHGTIGSHTIVTDGEALGSIGFRVDDGVTFNPLAASISAFVDDASPAEGAVGGELVFKTTTAGGSHTERLRIDNVGAIGIAGENYGTDGQVLTSGGAGAAVAWEDAAGGGTASWDAVAAASGGDYTTIQAADDALDATTTGYSLFVKGNQEYAEDVTISTDGAYIFIEGGGTTLDGDWTISGNNITVIVGSGSTIEGAWVLSGTGNTVEFGGGTSWTGNGTLSGVGGTLRIGGNTAHVGINTMSANSCSIYCGNGTETDGLVVTGLSCLFDGGGFYTTIDGGTARTAVAVTGGHGFRISNCAVENSRDNGNAYDGITLTDTAVFKIDNVHVHQSDQYGIKATSTSAYRGQISNVYMDACNDGGVYIDMPRVVMNNVIVSDSSLFGTVTGYGDNTSIVGCQSSNISTSSPLTIDTNAENCVVVGNRMDGSITDNSGTSTVASNDVQAL